jgi:hypothetical protein
VDVGITFAAFMVNTASATKVLEWANLEAEVAPL